MKEREKINKEKKLTPEKTDSSGKRREGFKICILYSQRIQDVISSITAECHEKDEKVEKALKLKIF